jgi:hypothetical protein
MQSPTEIPGLTQEEQKSSTRHSESSTVGAGSGGSTATVLGQRAGARRLGHEVMTVLGQEAAPRRLGRWERVGSGEMGQTCFGG